jgi:hypothetical protein
VTAYERALRDDIGDRRFIPHIQLHEFGDLIYWRTTRCRLRPPRPSRSARRAAIP